MEKEIKLMRWRDFCDELWSKECPRLVPRILATDASNLSSASETASTRIIEDDNKVYVDTDALHTDTIVQAQLLKRIRTHLNSFPRQFPTRRICPFCKQTLECGKRSKESNIDGRFVGALESCPNCTFWDWYYMEQGYSGRWNLGVYAYTTVLGKIREYEHELPKGCYEELAAWIRQNPSRWHSISPTQLEHLVAAVFRANYVQAEVSHVGQPDDGGVDVVYVDVEKRQWLIQVKRREKANHAKSVSTIRNLLGTMVLENSSFGIVVSTADHFSYQAYSAISRAGERSMTVRLIDRLALDHMLSGLLVERPWLSLIRSVFPEFADHFTEKIPSKRYSQLKLL